MDWRKRVDDLRAIQFLWVSLPIGTVLAALAGGALSAYSNLPWWSVAISSVAVLVFIAGGLNWLIGFVTSKSRPRPSSAYVSLTEAVDDGVRLADRMRQVKEADPTESELAAWKVRFQDWTLEAERVLGEVAPPRLGAFRADLIFADTIPGDLPRWISSDLMDLDLKIERLRQIRATL